METLQFSGRGEIYSYATIYDPQYAPEGFEKFVPYTVALIKLEEGRMITAMLTDLDPKEPIEIGMPVEMVTRILKDNGDKGVIIYGYKFRPVLKVE